MIVVNPCDSGKSVTKSTALWDDVRLGMGNGSNLPAGNILGVLHWAHVEQEDMKE